MAKEISTDGFARTSNKTSAAAVDTFHDMGVAARETAHGLNTLIEAVASDSKHGIRQLTHVIDKEASRVTGLVRHSIQERPNLAIGVAAGLGILLGLFLSSRR